MNSALLQAKNSTERIYQQIFSYKLLIFWRYLPSKCNLLCQINVMSEKRTETLGFLFGHYIGGPLYVFTGKFRRNIFVYSGKTPENCWKLAVALYNERDKFFYFWFLTLTSDKWLGLSSVNCQMLGMGFSAGQISMQVFNQGNQLKLFESEESSNGN